MLDNLKKYLSSQAIFTIIRYVLVAVGTFVVAKGWLPSEVWDEVLGAVLAVIATLVGVQATVTPKVVTNTGQTVFQKEMNSEGKAVVNAAAVEAKPSIVS